MIAWYRPEEIPFNQTSGIWSNQSSRGANNSLTQFQNDHKPTSIRINLGKNEYEHSYFCGPMPETTEPWPDSGIPFDSWYFRGSEEASGDWAGNYNLNSYFETFSNNASGFDIEKNKDYVVVAVHQSLFQSGIQPLLDPFDGTNEGFYLGQFNLDNGTILSLGSKTEDGNNLSGKNFTSFKANHSVADSLDFYTTQTRAIAVIGQNEYGFPTLNGSFLQAETVIDPQPRFTI